MLTRADVPMRFAKFGILTYIILRIITKLCYSCGLGPLESRPPSPRTSAWNTCGPVVRDTAPPRGGSTDEGPPKVNHGTVGGRRTEDRRRVAVERLEYWRQPELGGVSTKRTTALSYSGWCLRSVRLRFLQWLPGF